MLKRIELIAVPAALALCAAAFSFCGGASGYAHTQQPTATMPEQNRQLTPQERRVRAIYLRGESLSGREIMPSIGDLEVPATFVLCAGCHGRRAEGKTEGGVRAGSLTWANLTKSYGHTHPTGRKHGTSTTHRSSWRWSMALIRIRVYFDSANDSGSVVVLAVSLK